MASEELEGHIRNFDNIIDARFYAVDVRFNAIDKASDVLARTVGAVPTQLQIAIAGVESKLTALDTKWQVAFQSLKDAAQQQHQNDTISSNKSDANFKELLSKQETLLNATRDGLAGKLSTLETRLATIEANGNGARDNRNEVRSNVTLGIAIGGLLFAIVSGFVGFNLGHSGLIATPNYAPPAGFTLTPLQPQKP